MLKARLNGEFFRFICVGGVNTCLTYLIYVGALHLVPYRWAYTLSYGAGIAIAFLLNSLFVFQSRISAGKTAVYPAVYLAQYLLGVGLLSLFVESFHIDKRFASVMVIGVSVPISFLMNRLVLKDRKTTVFEEEGAPVQ